MVSKKDIIFFLFLLSSSFSYAGPRILHHSTAQCCPVSDPLTSGKELALGDLIAIGLKNNPDTRKAWATACSAYAFYRQTQSDNYPELNGSGVARYSHTEAKKSSLSSTNTTYTYNLLASYLLFDFGTRQYAQDSSRLAFCAARWSRDFTFQRVILEVIERYTVYMRAQESLKAREADLEDARISLEVGEAHYRAGVRKKADYLQVKAEFANGQIQLEAAKGNVEVAYSRLKNAIGISVQTPLLVAGLPEDFSPQDLDFVVDTLIETGLTSRKDLLAVCATVERKKADWQAARTLGLPTLSAEWLHGTAFNVTPDEKYHNSGVLALSVPIFRGFFYKFNADRACKDYLAAQADYRNTELNVGLEVTTNYWELKTAYQKYLHSLEYLSYSEEAYQSTLGNYRAGVGGLQALINSQDKLATARTEEVQSKSEWMISLARLIFSMGILDEHFTAMKDKR